MNKSKAPQYFYDEKSGYFSNFEAEAKRELRRDTYLAAQSLKKKIKEEETELLREQNDARSLQHEKERKAKELMKEISRLEAAKAKTLREEHESHLQSEIEKLAQTTNIIVTVNNFSNVPGGNNFTSTNMNDYFLFFATLVCGL